MHGAPRPAAPAARDALLLARWTALALLLLLALIEPDVTPAGPRTWVFVALFAGYSLLVDLAERRWGWPRDPLRPTLDLALAGGIYLLSGRDSSALFTLVFLAGVAAAATLPLRGALLSIIATIMIIVAGELTFRHPGSLRIVAHDIGARLLRIGYVALVAAILVRRATAQLTAAKWAQHESEHLAELDRLRANFVTAVSHDLQTPLTAIRAGLGLLEASASDRLRGDEAQLLTNARRNVDRLGLQIDDLLSLNQIEAGEFHLSPAPFDLRSVIASAVAVTHPLIQQQRQILQVDVDRPLMIEGDRRRLEQALVNLVANAHRHTPPGTRIAIRGQETPRGILLQVEDDGPGIPSDAQDRIFERFHQVDGHRAGSGLGLTIAKAVVERHGGRIWVQSEPGAGTVFSILLPRDGKEPSDVAESTDRR